MPALQLRYVSIQLCALNGKYLQATLTASIQRNPNSTFIYPSWFNNIYISMTLRVGHRHGYMRFLEVEQSIKSTQAVSYDVIPHSLEHSMASDRVGYWSSSLKELTLQCLDLDIQYL